MDKAGIFWGVVFGGIWGYLCSQLNWCGAEKVCRTIDMGYYNLMQSRFSNLVPDFITCTLIGVVLGGLAGMLTGSGRTSS